VDSAHQPHGFEAVSGFANNEEIRLGFERINQSRDEDGLAVCDEDTNRRHVTSLPPPHRYPPRDDARRNLRQHMVRACHAGCPADWLG
jgi:hypothetical protein